MSLDSICFDNLIAKAAVMRLIGICVRRKHLIPVHIGRHTRPLHRAERFAAEVKITPSPYGH
ncbi:hypothetical protein PCAR4_570128 [Paraburkholderia caribensis]|nr:hypothetical protein PCAR4_570128 [Paraburkholderia caribensis]